MVPPITTATPSTAALAAVMTIRVAAQLGSPRRRSQLMGGMHRTARNSDMKSGRRTTCAADSPATTITTAAETMSRRAPRNGCDDGGAGATMGAFVTARRGRCGARRRGTMRPMTSDLSRPGARRLPAASWVIAAALAAWACKGKGSGEDRPAPEAAEEKAEPAAPPPMPAPTVPSAGPSDVPEAAGAPISIDQVTIRPVAFQEGRRDPPSHEVGVFVVGYRVHPPAGRPRIASAPVRIACRIGDLLLARAVSRSDGSLATSGVRRSDDEPLQLSALYRPDPYEIAPELCEITFLYDDGEQVTTAAVACFRGKELVDGACPAEELKVPARGEDIVTVERGELAASAKHFNFRGVFTLNQALPPG